jgi:hypothetical protein
MFLYQHFRYISSVSLAARMAASMAASIQNIAAPIADGVSSCESGKEASGACVIGFLEHCFSTPESGCYAPRPRFPVPRPAREQVLTSRAVPSLRRACCWTACLRLEGRKSSRCGAPAGEPMRLIAFVIDRIDHADPRLPRSPPRHCMSPQPPVVLPGRRTSICPKAIRSPRGNPRTTLSSTSG